MRRSLLLFLLLILAVSFPAPVQADLILPAITHVYFEKDGAPYNGSVQYTVTCYGYSNPGWPFQTTTLAPGTYEPQEVYRYSATCPGYGCTIYEPYYYKPNILDWCDLEGETPEGRFTIPQFSRQPDPENCTWLPHKESLFYVGGNLTHLEGYFYYPPEYLACAFNVRNRYGNATWQNRNYTTCTSPDEPGCITLFEGIKPVHESSAPTNISADWSVIPVDTKDYIVYLENCTPGTDPSCPGWIVDGMPLKKTGIRPFRDNATLLQDDPCRTFLVKMNSSLVIPKTEQEFPHPYQCAGFCNETYRVCDMRITIPSGTGTASPENPAQGFSAPLPAGRRSPVESLYCSIVELMGGRCE